MITGGRRVVGTGLVLAVLLAVLVGARWDGLRVAGSASVAPWTGPPAVGDCVAAFTAPSPPLFPLVFGLSAATVGADAAIFADCAGSHVGEVAAFRRIDSVGGAAAHDGSDRASDAQWCTEVAVGYREHLRWQVQAVTAGQWDPVVAHRFVAILGGPGSEPDGSRWAVCAVLAPGLERYHGSYLDSMADAAAPAPFGYCRSGGTPDRRLSCQMPHREQVFGTSVGRWSAAGNSCRELVQQATGMADVTAGGRLRVVVIGRDGTAGDRAAGDGAAGDGAAACVSAVVGSAALTGTMLGIGDAPLPVAG